MLPKVEVLPNTGATAAPAPGWAYVIDSGYDPSKAPINPAARKRVSRNPNVNSKQAASTATVRQEAQSVKRITELDRENTKDVPIPAEYKKRREGQKMTPNVRRILGSGRNFWHWLDEEEAKEHPSRPVPVATSSGSGTPLTGRQSISKGKTPASRAKRGSTIQAISDIPATPSAPAPSTPIEAHDAPTPVPVSSFAMDVDVPMPDEDDDPLLRTDIPKAIPPGVLESLLAAPPLPYSAAKVSAPPEDGPPKRLFCELCGHWGTYHCRHCGERFCGHECQKTHLEMKCLRM